MLRKLRELTAFHNLLIAIEELPEDIKSAEKIAQWLSSETGLEISGDGEYINFDFLSSEEESKSEDLKEPNFVAAANFTVPGALACIGALGGLIPATKILKINKVLKAAGGAVNVMKDVHMNYKYYRIEKKYSKKKALDTALNDFSVKKKLSAGSKALLKDFFNLSAIAGACGSLFTYENNYENDQYFFNEDNLRRLT
ncbi:hypothetical protein AB1L05_15685 [Cytobacillus horneckiae]|uniref:hypothetical protein n=1 Tax=Cytobacillus horneckiae TaxID=549687 RepID=UPI0034CE0672